MKENEAIYRSLLESIKKAIDAGRNDIIKVILSSEDSKKTNFLQYLSSCCLPEGNLLHHACKLGNVDLIRILLQCGVDPSVKNHEHKHPLELCPLEPASLRHRVRLAFTQQAILAISTNNIETLRTLLKGGLSCDAMDSEVTRNSLLHWAVGHGTVEAVVKLLDCGANVNITNAQGVTPLHEAILRGEVGILEELLYFGADKSLAATSGPHVGKTAVDLAAAVNTNLLELLEQPGEFILHQQMNQTQPPTLTSEAISTSQSNNKIVATDSISDKSITLSRKLLDSSTPLSTATLSEKRWTECQLREKLCPPPQHLRLLPHSSANNLGFPLFKTRPLNVLLFADFDNSHTKRNFVEYLEEEWRECSSSGLFVQTQIQSAVHFIDVATYSLNGPVVIAAVDPLVARSKSDAYSILVQSQAIWIHAVNITALQYAFLTLFQLLHIFTQECTSSLVHMIPLKVTDWSSLPRRGVLLDLSTERRVLLPVRQLWLKAWARIKANEVHFFVCLSVVLVSNGVEAVGNNHPEGDTEESQMDSPVVSVSASHPLEEVRMLVRECERMRLTPVLALDTNCAPEHFAFLTEHPSLQQLLDIFPANGSVSLSPRMSALLCDHFTGLMTGTEPNATMRISTRVPPILMMRAATGRLLLASDVFHAQHRTVAARTGQVEDDGSEEADREAQSEVEESLISPHRRVWPCLVDYVLNLSSPSQNLQARWSRLNRTCPSLYLALSTNTWCRVGGDLRNHLRQLLQRVVASPHLGWLQQLEESALCGLVSCEWSSGAVEGAALTHTWFSAPLHLAHLALAWNAAGWPCADGSTSWTPADGENLVEALLVYVSRSVATYVHREPQLDLVQDYILEVDNFETFLMAAMPLEGTSTLSTNSSTSLLLLDWRLLESHCWDDLSKLALTPYYFTIRLRLKALGQLRESTVSSRLLSFYLRYMELFCRFIQVIRKCQASESSVLNRALMTDLANRLLSLSEDGKEMFAEWYVNGAALNGEASEETIDPFLRHMRVMLCRLVPEGAADLLCGNSRTSTTS